MEQLILIKTVDELRKLQDYLADKEFVAYDTETDGVLKESRIIGMSVSADTEVGYYVILSYWDAAQQKLIDLETKNQIKDLIMILKSKSLIMHNAIFDCWMTDNNFGISLIESVHTDTMILGHILDENRSNGLKELGVSIFGEDARKEQIAMKESVTKNGGQLTRANYELFKADAELIGQYGAKDAILTIKLFYHLVPQLYEQGLDKFFYEDESMPLLRGPTYDLNTSGLRVNVVRLQQLKKELETECMEAKAFIHKEIEPLVKEQYKGKFNLDSSKQRAWLLFVKLGNEFRVLTKGGKELCKALNIKVPYGRADKFRFIQMCIEQKGQVYCEAAYNNKTKKMGRPKKIADPWHYVDCGKESLKKLAPQYKWVDRLLEYSKNMKLLTTYVEGIGSRMQYSVIRPSFLQHGTTSGRYSSKNPNFQNLPRDDKRVKACIVARPGNVFVGSDFSQLEPRVFASISQDQKLMECFSSGKDFYSVIGMEVFGKTDCTPYKEGENAFGVKYKKLRDISKVMALSATYGTTAFKMGPAIGKSTEEAQQDIDRYFEKFPKVQLMMLDSHEQAKTRGRVENLYGRPRRMPEAAHIKEVYGGIAHDELPYEARNVLNLAVNHRIQSTGASIMNRAAIACWQMCKELAKSDIKWSSVKMILQVHDEVIMEGPAELAEDMVAILRSAMENTTALPGVALEAEPKISNDLAGLK